MGRKMWSPGDALPVFLLLLSANVNSGSVINGDGLLFREPDSDLWSAPASAPALAPAPALGGYRQLRQLAGTSPPDLEEMGPYNCPESGFFAKNGTCTDYYKCEDTSEPGTLTPHLFSCSLGMVFDDNLGTCNLAFQVTTRPECNVTTDGTNRFSLLTDDSWQIEKFQCTTQTVQEMAEGTDKICTNVNYVEDYVSLVMSMIPLREYHKNDEKIADILEDYDRDLESAQNHAKLWREGESILIGIGQTIKLAKDFEPEFTRKYERNKQRVKTIEENLHEENSIKETRKAIATLEERILNTTKLINSLPKEHRAIMLPIKTSLEKELVEKRHELKENFVLIRELEELVVFLEFVRNDASNIRRVANETRKRIQEFKKYLNNDKNVFLRHYKVAELTLETHINETKVKSKKLADIAAKKAEAETAMKEQREAVKKMRQSITDKLDKASKMRREILNRGPSAKATWGIILSFIPFVGAALLASANADEKREFQKLDAESDILNKEIENINSRIEDEMKDIDRLQDQIIQESGLSKDIQNTLHDYTILNHDLGRMGEQLDQLLPAIDKAIHGIDGIECIFVSVIGKLDALVKHAKEAKTESEKLNARYIAYYEISVLKDNWKGAHDLLLNLDKCPGILL